MSDYVVDKKYCVSACMHTEFRSFQNEGKSWGTGSSSMNGLNQDKIYDRVKQECVAFYAEEKCCKRSGLDIEAMEEPYVHGYDFGACVKDIKK